MQVKFTKISYSHIGCNLIEVWFTQNSRFIQGSVSTGVTTSELSFSLLYIVGCLFFVIYCWLSFLCYILLVVFSLLYIVGCLFFVIYCWLFLQELYELAQRKFHHQISQYALTQDTGLPYPRLFVVDILKEKGLNS